jgi:uncharacterized Zn-binding protein involved in type VI secretion
MGKLVANADAEIQCVHGVKASITGTAEKRLTIKTKNVFTVMNGTVEKCPQKPTPCSSFTIAKGTAAKLTVGGNPVILKGDMGTTNGAPTNGCEVKEAGQSILITA